MPLKRAYPEDDGRELARVEALNEVALLLIEGNDDALGLSQMTSWRAAERRAKVRSLTDAQRRRLASVVLRQAVKP